ncbi:uncharacterized protein METZ01_LOCUS274272, partial [marine metagenome]
PSRWQGRPPHRCVRRCSEEYFGV